MKIGVMNNFWREETRVCATPKSVAAYIKDGHDVVVEKGAGQKSGFDDEQYIAIGAKTGLRENVLNCDFILSVLPPRQNDLAFLKENQWLICDLTSFDDKAKMQDLAKTDVNVIDLGKMPRISRAQSMDILSSQSMIAGYKAATMALNRLSQTAPLLMTSAGTLFPAKAVVIGAGVAGMQAISVLRRMGANVVASDIRSESKTEIESVGGKFALNAVHEVKTANILICSAFSKGKKPPLLVEKEYVQNMPFASVVIDMAEGNVETGFMRDDIYFVRDKYLERKVALSASLLFSNNVQAFLKTFDYMKKADFEDEILRDVLVCANGFLRGRMK